MFMFLILVGLMGEGNLLFASQRSVNTSRLITYNTLEEINHPEYLSLTTSAIKENDRDTLKEKNLSFWRKLSYGIGYSGGLCWAGSDLSEDINMTLDPMILLKANFYLLNSIELSATYPMNENRGIEVGVGWGWAELEHTIRLGDCTLSKVSFSLSNKTKTIAEGIEITLAKTISDWWSLDGERYQILRYYIGGGIIIKWQWNIYRSSKFSVISELSTRINGAKEYLSDAPWHEEKNIVLVFSGIYASVKINFGGVK